MEVASGLYSGSLLPPYFQADVCAACRVRNNDLQLILKPYQLVGVNFLMLLQVCPQIVTKLEVWI